MVDDGVPDLTEWFAIVFGGRTGGLIRGWAGGCWREAKSSCLVG